MMRQFRLLILLGLMPMYALANADNYPYTAANVFKEGTRWETVMGHTYTIAGETDFLGYKCLKMQCFATGDENPDMQLRVYIRVEDNKVYFVDCEDATEWLLLYDFGLNLGDNVKVYQPYNSWNDKSYEHFVFNMKFDNVYYALDYSPWYGVMMFGNCEDEDVSSISDSAYWINGIGSMRGPLEPTFRIIPGGDMLTKVICDNEVIYENNLNSLNDVVTANDVEVRVNGRELTIAGREEQTVAYIYTIDGTLITSQIVGEEAVSVELKEEGLYLISVNGRTTKVAVR